MIDLREYQKKAIDDVRAEIMNGHKKVMLMMPTGSGKSRTAAAIIESALNKGKQVLFIADLKTLVDQATNGFVQLGIDCSVVMADDERYAPWKNLQVCSAQTLARRKIPDADLVIIDEAHIQYKYLTELMDQWSLVPFIGLSATPFSRGLGNHYSSLVIGPTTTELINSGYLIEPVCYGPATVNTSGIPLSNGDYEKEEQHRRFKKPKVVADIIDTYLELGESRKFILFPVNVAHSKELVNSFNEAGIPVAHIDAHTKDDERQRCYEQLKTGELVGLSSVGVLSKGFDETSVSCVILAFITKSLMKFIQTVGRGLRAHEGQADCIVLDHGGNVDRLGYPDDDLPDTLCNGDKTESKAQDERDEEKEDKELQTKTCPTCNMVVRPKVFTCPKCGHIFAQKSKIEIEQGRLEKLARKEKTEAGKRNILTSKEDKQAFYSAALGHAEKKGFKEGWASNKYRDFFSVWPNAMNAVAGEMTPMFKSYLTACNIRYAKSKQRKTA